MKRTALLAAIIALLTISVVNAQPMKMGMMADELKLSDQQIAQFQKLQMQFERDMVKPQSDLKLARLDLKEIMMQQTIDEKAALGKQDRISAIKADIAKMRLQHMIAAQKILTPDQLTQWKKMHRGMGGMRGMRGPGGHRSMDCGGPCMMGGGPMGPGMMGHQMMMEKKEVIEHKDKEPDK